MEFLLKEGIEEDKKLWVRDITDQDSQNMEIKIRYEAK
jgi:hypothetical protein